MPPFDPYAAWLDIPPHHQPPQPWRLLAVTPDCRDPALLRAAAERAEQRVRQSAGAEHAAWVERLVVEIRAAERAINGGAAPTHSGERPLAPPTSAIPAPVSPTPTQPVIGAPPPPASPQLQTPETQLPAPTPSGAPTIPPPPAAATQNVAASQPAAPAERPIGAQPSTSQPVAEQPVASPHTAAPSTTNNATPAAGPLPLGPPLQTPGSPNATQLPPLNQPEFPQSDFAHEELESDDADGPSPILIAAISIACFLVGVVLMLIFLMLR